MRYLLCAECFWTLETDDSLGKYVAITLTKKNMGYNSWDKLLESEVVKAEVTDRIRRAGEEGAGGWGGGGREREREGGAREE